MSEAQDKPASLLSEINLPLFAGLFTHTCLIYVVVAMGRITTSYAALDLQLSFAWVGVISAAFSIFPVFMAVPLGRFIDRGFDALSVKLGSIALIISGALFAFAPLGPISLMLGTTFLGVGQIGCMAGHQMIAIRAGKTRRGRDAVFGYHMVAIASGQAIGPVIMGWIAGDARVPPVQWLFYVSFGFTLVSLIASLFLPAARRIDQSERKQEPISLADLARIRGFLPFIAASIMTITALDLIVVYLPLLGAERDIDAATIGWLMFIRAAGSMLARVLYVPLMELMGRNTLTYLSLLSPAIAFIAIAYPLPVWLLYPALAISGMGLGVAATLTLSGTVDLAPTHARATAMSLRLTGNRIGMVVIPLVASAVATASGAAGVFVILAITLSSSAAGIWTSRRND
jgi:MFS family permease